MQKERLRKHIITWSRAREAAEKREEESEREAAKKREEQDRKGKRQRVEEHGNEASGREELRASMSTAVDADVGEAHAGQACVGLEIVPGPTVIAIAEFLLKRALASLPQLAAKDASITEVDALCKEENSGSGSPAVDLMNNTACALANAALQLVSNSVHVDGKGQAGKGKAKKGGKTGGKTAKGKHGKKVELIVLSSEEEEEEEAEPRKVATDEEKSKETYCQFCKMTAKVYHQHKDERLYPNRITFTNFASGCHVDAGIMFVWALILALAEMTTCAETRDIVERGLMRYPHVSLGKRLGAGLFGSVHLVKSTLPGFDHPLVVKVAKIPRATNLVHIQQVIVDLSAGVAREAALMTIAGRREGTCPRVAGLWAPVETVGGIVMEMVTGDLKAARDASEYNRPFDVRTPPILAKCAKVLSNLHSVGIIHNDLKCDNFLYKVEEGTAEPTIYIGDLGQATRVNEMAPMRVPGQSRWHPATVLHPSAKALRGTIQARPEHDVYAFLVMVDDLFRRSPKCFVRKATDPVLWELCRKIAFRQQYKHDIVLPDMAGLADMFHKARIFVPDAYPKQ
eukprot:jgi/Mesvir1/7898/Mv11830-RA.1